MKGNVLLLAVIVISIVEAGGLELTFSRNKVIMGDAGETMMTCSVDESDIANITGMRARTYQNDRWRIIALLDANGIDKKIAIDDLTGRVKVDGFINITHPAASKLTLTFNISNLQCSDGTVYECSVMYLSTIYHTMMNSTNGTLEVYVYPMVTKFEVKLNGDIIRSPVTANKTSVKVGDTLEFMCIANVGSNKKTSIQWRTAEICLEDIWIEYQPQTDVKKEEIATYDGNCGYLRTATLSHNVTSVGRTSQFGFECYVAVSDPPYFQFRTTDNPRFYVKVFDSPKDVSVKASSSASCKCTCGDNTGTILAASFGILSFVLIVYSGYVTLMLQKMKRKGHTSLPHIPNVPSLMKVKSAGNIIGDLVNRPKYDLDGVSRNEENDYDYLDEYTRSGNKSKEAVTVPESDNPSGTDNNKRPPLTNKIQNEYLDLETKKCIFWTDIKQEKTLPNNTQYPDTCTKQNGYLGRESKEIKAKQAEYLHVEMRVKQDSECNSTDEKTNEYLTPLSSKYIFTTAVKGDQYGRFQSDNHLNEVAKRNLRLGNNEENLNSDTANHEYFVLERCEQLESKKLDHDVSPKPNECLGLGSEIQAYSVGAEDCTSKL